MGDTTSDIPCLRTNPRDTHRLLSVSQIVFNPAINKKRLWSYDPMALYKYLYYYYKIS